MHLQVDLQGKILELNPLLEKYSQYSTKELYGKQLLDFIHPEDRVKAKTKFQQLVTGQIATYRNQIQYLAKDKSSLSIQELVSLVRYEEKQPVYAIFTLLMSE
jgi:PAS domain S-box-containing protein